MSTLNYLNAKIMFQFSNKHAAFYDNYIEFVGDKIDWSIEEGKKN